MLAKILIYPAVLLFGLSAYGNICVVQPVTVSHVRGHVVYTNGTTEYSAGSEMSAELWQTVRDGSRLLISKTTIDAKGNFSFGKIRPGSYSLTFNSPGASDGFWIHVRGPNAFHWRRKNWLEIGVGMMQPNGCPPSYIRTLRKKISSTQ